MHFIFYLHSRFPTEMMWKERWIKVIRDSRNEEDWLPSKYSVVCSIHFEECDIYYTKCGLRRIKKNAKPKKVLWPKATESLDILLFITVLYTYNDIFFVIGGESHRL